MVGACARSISRPHPWMPQQIVDYLASGLASEHGAAAGPMRNVTENLGRVPRDDVEAIAAYLLSIQRPWRVAKAQPAPGDMATRIDRSKQVLQAPAPNVMAMARPCEAQWGVRR